MRGRVVIDCGREEGLEQEKRSDQARIDGPCLDLKRTEDGNVEIGQILTHTEGRLIFQVLRRQSIRCTASAESISMRDRWNRSGQNRGQLKREIEGVV